PSPGGGRARRRPAPGPPPGPARPRPPALTADWRVSPGIRHEYRSKHATRRRADPRLRTQDDEGVGTLVRERSRHRLVTAPPTQERLTDEHPRPPGHAHLAGRRPPARRPHRPLVGGPRRRPQPPPRPRAPALRRPRAEPRRDLGV